LVYLLANGAGCTSAAAD